jgi:glyoxylase-like metal-dependent hydrolase (beta-lactamase superfamily II)
MAAPVPANEPVVHAVFECVTGTYQYVVADPTSKNAVVIDPVLDFDPTLSKITTASADDVLNVIREHGYNVTHVLETHAHADHVTASRYIQHSLTQPGRPGPLVAIGARIKEVQATFAPVYGIPAAELDGAFDKLLADDETIPIGALTATALHLPGHTPDSMGFAVGSCVFVGDSIFNPDVGTSRCDFPGGSATALNASVRRLLALPEGHKLYTGHDYPPSGREPGPGPVPYYTVGQQKAQNKQAVMAEKEFVEWREKRDATLGEPRLIHQALQVNIRGGRLPARNAGGTNFIMVPVRGSEALLGML